MSYRRDTKAIRKAVIPVAGLGTRFLPVTRVVPKALLPVLNTPLIHYAVEEAAAAGIREVLLIVAPGMETVTQYFNRQALLEATLLERGQTEILREQRRISELVDMAVVIQHAPLGNGHAVLLARDFVGNEAFAVILPDDFIISEPPAIAQLLTVHSKYGGSVLAAQEVERELIPKKGIIDGALLEDGVVSVKRLVEKPKAEHAPSNMAIVGRYVLDPSVFGHLTSLKPGVGGEIWLADALAKMIGETPMHACTVKGHLADAGVPVGLLAATLHEAKKDPTLRKLVEDTVAQWGRIAASS